MCQIDPDSPLIKHIKYDSSIQFTHKHYEISSSILIKVHQASAQYFKNLINVYPKHIK